MPTVDFDLEDYEYEIKKTYCEKNCLLSDTKIPPIITLKEYVNELYKELYIYPDKCNKTVKDIYYELERIIN